MNPAVAAEERLPVLRAVEREAAGERGALRSHWYQCDNGHPYFVGACGVPREAGRCVDCGRRIGGDRGRLILFQSK